MFIFLLRAMARSLTALMSIGKLDMTSRRDWKMPSPGLMSLATMRLSSSAATAPLFARSTSNMPLENWNRENLFSVRIIVVVAILLHFVCVIELYSVAYVVNDIL